MSQINACVEDNLLKELLILLKLERIKDTKFRGQSQDLGWGNVFGGQVLGQALSAAYRTVQSNRKAHSLHAYFLRRGDVSEPIVYEVDCIRDGKSFTTRRVVAFQKDRAIFNMSASFQVEEPGFDHHVKAPNVKGPQGIETEMQFALKIQSNMPDSFRKTYLCKKPIEIRLVNPFNPLSPKKREPVQYTWFRTADKMPDDFAIHQYMLAYASDFNLSATPLYPHGHTEWDPDMQTASLDHAMWFHRDFRMDEWLLYVINSPNAFNARGLAYGHVYTQKGKLVATVVQEGLFRNWDMNFS